MSAGEGDPASERLQHLQRLASVGTLCTAAFHDLANLITRLQVSLRALERGPDAQLLAQAIACTAEVAEIARDVTRYARARPARLRPTDVHAILERALRLVSHRLGAIEVRRLYSDSLPPVGADGHRLGQVFVNLLNNAIDAAEASAGPTRLTLRSSLQGESVRVDVEDSGPGIPPEQLSQIFEMFFTTKPPGEGVGIGLSISREIVRTHGGDLQVASEPGEGATFTVLLPPTRE